MLAAVSRTLGEGCVGKAQVPMDHSLCGEGGKASIKKKFLNILIICNKLYFHIIHIYYFSSFMDI